MKIVIDNIIFSIQKSGGVSIVWYEFIKRILIKKYDLTFIEYKNTKNNIFGRKLNLSKYKLVYPKYLVFKIERYRNLYFRRKKNDRFIFHSSYYRTCLNKQAINITTVHDFTYEYFSNGIKKYIHCWQKHRAIKKSDYIICISENTRSDLHKFVSGIDDSRIKVIYNGVSNEYFPMKSNEFLKPLNPFRPYSFVLFVGGRGTYKNFELAVKAVAETELNLIIVGAPLTKKESLFLENKMDKSRYCNRVRVSNTDLNSLYNQAFCLLYPSSYEGFGIPVIESQKAGCPVIAYNGSSIPEIIGDTPLLIDDLNIEVIKEKIKLLTDDENRKKIIKKGIENVQRFSWDAMTENILMLYDKALNG